MSRCEVIDSRYSCEVFQLVLCRDGELVDILWNDWYSLDSVANWYQISKTQRLRSVNLVQQDRLETLVGSSSCPLVRWDNPFVLTHLARPLMSAGASNIALLDCLAYWLSDWKLSNWTYGDDGCGDIQLSERLLRLAMCDFFLSCGWEVAKRACVLARFSCTYVTSNDVELAV